MRVFLISFILLLFLAFCNSNARKVNSNPTNQDRVYYLSIIEDFGAVSPSYSNYVKKNLEIVSADPHAKAFIIEIDTPGGTLSDAQKIATYIKNSKVKTIAFINDSAYSAGAIISLASDYVIVAEGGKLGDAYPIVMDPSSGQASSIKDKKVYAKIMSGLTALMKSLADKRIERLSRDISNGKKEYLHLKNNNSVRNLKRIFSAMVDPDIELSLENDGYELKKGEVLTLTSKEAYDIGVSDGIYNTLEDIIRVFGLDEHELVKLEATTEDRLLSILTHPAVTSLLLSIGMLGIIMELWTAGWGIAGTIGLLSLSLFFYGSFVGGDASYQTLILFLISIVLLSVELFITPGFGILGIAGMLALFLSFMSALGVDFFNLQEGLSNVTEALAIIISSIVIVIIVIILFSKRFKNKKSRLSKITLQDINIESKSHTDDISLVGKEGVALTTLRPSGTVLIDDLRYDVITNGEFIDKDARIKVLSSIEGKITVKSL